MNRLLDENFPLVHGDLLQPFEDFFCQTQVFLNHLCIQPKFIPFRSDRIMELLQGEKS